MIALQFYSNLSVALPLGATIGLERQWRQRMAGLRTNALVSAGSSLFALHRFTACAKTGDEAWSYATQVCKDAMPPKSSYFPAAKICTVEGQTGCS